MFGSSGEGRKDLERRAKTEITKSSAPAFDRTLENYRIQCDRVPVVITNSSPFSLQGVCFHFMICPKEPEEWRNSQN